MALHTSNLPRCIAARQVWGDNGVVPATSHLCSPHAPLPPILARGYLLAREPSLTPLEKAATGGPSKVAAISSQLRAYGKVGGESPQVQQATHSEQLRLDDVGPGQGERIRRDVFLPRLAQDEDDAVPLA